MKKEGVLMLLEHLEKPACVMDQLGYIKEVNNAYAELYQYTKEELVGKHFLLLVPTNVDFQIPLLGEEDVFKHPKKYKVQRKDGTQFYIQSITYDYYLDGERYRLCVDEYLNEIKNKFALALNGKSLYLEKDEFKIFIDSYFQREKKEFTFLNLKFYFDITNEVADKHIKRDVKVFLKDTFKEESVIICPFETYNYLVFIDKLYDITELKNKIENEFFYKFMSDKHIFNNMFKMGVLLSSEEDLFSFESIYKKSDLARFLAKANSYTFFSKNKIEEDKEKSNLSIELLSKDSMDEFVYHYQPLFDKNSNLVGSECLIRWNNKKRGLVPPSEFIPIIEENGKIIEVEKKLIKKLLKLNTLVKKDLPLFTINLSCLHFRNMDFYYFIEDLVKLEGYKVENIIFEITETVLMQNLNYSSKILLKLKELGVKIAIDDFGVGYSSLIYLKELPVDILKIDRSFIKNIHKNPKNKAIVRYIVSMAKTIGLKVISEGVEVDEELEQLKEMSIDIYQGFYFSKGISKLEYFTKYIDRFINKKED